ncbi:MAG: NAD-dependent epimerase/dehydratase family protein [Alphaproteobacteria bacterium]
MTILVTGAAGFIGYHLCEKLLARGESVLGVDNVNDYYDVGLKEARLARLDERPGFALARLDIADHEALAELARRTGGVRRVVHLAAQAGVRYSLDHPFAYVRANLVGHMAVLEMCRHLPDFEHLVYASSSSVYGGNTKLPFAVEDRVDTPSSLYAATKRADELMSYSYAHLYRLPQTGLRFFTVYGPWGRPDMALYIFTRAILAGEPIRVFNHGDMMRDFTFIDDIVAGVVAALDSPPPDTPDAPPQRLYNIGNHRSEPLLRLIEVLEDALGRKAETILEPMQPGDVKETFADIAAIQRDLGYRPTTPIDVGVPRFVAWYRDYHGA